MFSSYMSSWSNGFADTLNGTIDEKIGPFLEADTYTMEKILTNSGNYSGKQLIEGLIRNGVINYDVVNFARREKL